MALNSTIFLADSELRVDETAGSVTERITRNGSLADAVTITYGVTGDTAVSGQDFVGGFGTVTMPAGSGEVSVSVPVLDDAAAEATELFVFSLINVEGGTLWAPRTSRVSIIDNEAPPPPPPLEPPLSSDYDVAQVPVVGGFDEPVKFEFSPVSASRIYVAEKSGIIRTADINTGATSVVLDITGRVNEHQDRGLMDIALHPDFTNTPYIYAFAVIDPAGSAALGGNAGQDGVGNRYAQVLRFTADAGTGYTTIVPGSEVVLLGGAGRSLDDISGGGRDDFTDPAFAGATASDRFINTGAPPQPVIDGFKQDYIKVDSASHAGGALSFGPDGALYVAIGDGTSFDYADPRSPDVQSLDSLSGKILRVDPLTGLAFRDNPFADPGVGSDTNRAKIWQLGLRNPFSTAFDEEGRLFMTNTGWNSYEAINLGGPGANFGWPYYEGGDGGVLLETPVYRDFGSARPFYDAVGRGDIKVTPAFRAFSHASEDPGFQVQAITGGDVIYDGGVYPAAFLDDFFFADFSGREVYTVDVNDRTSLKFLYQRGDSAPIDFVQGPNGYVYYADIVAGQIGRLEISGIAPPPPPPPPGGSAETTIGAGPDALVLRIVQDVYLGSAQYTVSVDGVQIGGVLTATAVRGSGVADTVTVRGDFAAGGHTASVRFINDAYGGSATADRNLYVESATYNGAAVAGAAAGLFDAGTASFGFTDAGGGTPPPPTGGASVTVGAGPDAIVLRIVQDAYLGDAQYTVSVDGVQIGGTLTAQAVRGSGAADTVTVLGDFAPGAHTVSVRFTNDLYGGSAAADRNLYVESATYNGAAFTASASLYDAGVASFGFTEAGAPPPPPPTGGSTETTVGTGPDALVLRVSQDAYLGSAQYTVSVDGVQIGGVLTATAIRGSGATDTITVRGDFAPGGHTATVNFINDVYGGSAAADRNLYVESATYNGAAFTASATLYDAGAASFGFTEAGAPPPPPPAGGSTTTTIGSGPDTLVLRVSQDAYLGSAQYTVSVDGTQIGGVQTATALRSSGLSDTVNVLSDLAPGGHTVTVSFVNDLYGGSAAADRNFYVDGATYNGAAFTASATLYDAGAASFGFTEAGAPPPPPPAGGSATTTVGSGSDALVLRIAQDAYLGSAQYTVSVDGAQIGGVQTATALRGSGVTDTVTVRGDFAPGGHTVSVSFINDAYAGTAATDRNLYVDGATYNGAAVAGVSAALYDAGTASFGITDSSPIA